jgi:O-antigen ligase
LTGVGANEFPVMEGLTLKEAGLHGKWSAPHNAYLQAFSELGIPGGIIFIVILLSAAKRAFRLARPKPGRGPPALPRPEYLASLVAFASGAYFLSHAYFYAMFALTGMIAFTTHVAARQSALESRGPQPPSAGPRRAGLKRSR